MARPRTPTQALALRGSGHARKSGQGPPTWMRHPEAKAEWKRITRLMEESRGDARMTPAGREQIATLCEL